MATFDGERNCYVVRIVYDGPGLAGKTTNLAQICERVPLESRSEMITPASLKGRTMFFDWLELAGPDLGDKGLRFQLISVPGQAQRNYRRRPLVEVADVVVLVCEPTASGIRDTQRVWAQLRVGMRQREQQVPVVFQANKQDLEGKLSDAALRRRLRVAEDAPLVPAVANRGEGVWETLAIAMRLGVEGLDEQHVEPLLPAFADADALFDHVLQFEDEPRAAQPVAVEELHFGLDEAEEELPAQRHSDQVSGARSRNELQERARQAALKQKRELA